MHPSCSETLSQSLSYVTGTRMRLTCRAGVARHPKNVLPLLHREGGVFGVDSLRLRTQVHAQRHRGHAGQDVQVLVTWATTDGSPRKL